MDRMHYRHWNISEGQETVCQDHRVNPQSLAGNRIPTYQVSAQADSAHSLTTRA